MTVALEAGLVGRNPQTLCAFYTRVMGFALVDCREFDAGTVYRFRRDAPLCPFRTGRQPSRSDRVDWHD